MEEFLNKLYNYEYFGMYLMIAIAVLVLLFIIVLFFGKKDQKKREIEETRKLQQINNTDAFKEESNVESVEVPKEEVKEPVVTQEQLENDTIIVPNINDLTADVKDEVNNIEMPEPILPKEEVNEEPLNIEFNDASDFSNEKMESIAEPVLDKIEEKPLVFNDDASEEEPTFTMPEDNNTEPTVPLVDVPDFNLDEISSEVEEIKKESVTKPTEIFSSVYAPQKEEIELPKVEEKKINKDDLDIELPTLKKDKEKEEIEMPELNDYNFDNIAGEDYNINK